MDEVTGLLESEMAALLVEHGVVGCAVLPGAATGERPDEYVSVVAVESDYRARNAYVVEVEFRCVVPLDDAGALERQKRRLRAVVDFINAPSSPARTHSRSNLVVSGLVMRRISRELGERSSAEIARVRFGAEVFRATYPTDIGYVVE